MNYCVVECVDVYLLLAVEPGKVSELSDVDTALLEWPPFLSRLLDRLSALTVLCTHAVRLASCASILSIRFLEKPNRQTTLTSDRKGSSMQINTSRSQWMQINLPKINFCKQNLQNTLATLRSLMYYVIPQIPSF